jgi:endonuclease YncB( thermonuclease family)
MSAKGPAARSTREPYFYRLKAVVKVVDSGTIDLVLDLRFSLTLRPRMRLIVIDAQEIRSKDPAEKARVQEILAFVNQMFQQPGQVLVGSTKEEKYGRMLANCYREGVPILCSELLARGLAKANLP